MYYPTLEQVKKMAGQGNLVPVYRSINADLETPVSAYLKVAQGPYSFLLESVEGGERVGRYSFIGTDPFCRSQVHSGEIASRGKHGRRTRHIPSHNYIVAHGLAWDQSAGLRIVGCPAILCHLIGSYYLSVTR